MTQLGHLLTAEAAAYLAAVDAFRENGNPPQWKSEDSERDDFWHRSLSRKEIRAQVNRMRESDAA